MEIKTIIKKSPMRISISIIVVVIVLFTIVSFYIWDSNSWLSSVFLSFGCGLLSGLLVYFLSNRRNNQLYRFEFEYSLIKHTFSDAKSLYLLTEYYLNNHKYECMDEEDLDRCLNDILSKAEMISEGLYDYPEALFDQFRIDVSSDTILDIDYLWDMFYKNDYYDKDGLSMAESILREVNCKMHVIIGKIQPIKNTWKEKYNTLRKCFI